MALAHGKTYWAEMDATTVAAQGLAIGRVAAEHYFEEVLEGRVAAIATFASGSSWCGDYRRTSLQC